MTHAIAFPDARILLFCRAPVCGQVKTRLARSIGNAAATRCHQALASHCLETITSATLAPLQLWCSPDARSDFFTRQTNRFSLSLHTQADGDLGEKMYRAFDVALADAAYALVIGTDCPALDADYLRQALLALQKGAPAVIGPAEDGGYVLLGLRRNEPRLFEDIPWGTDAVFDMTRQRLPEDAQVLPVLWDIDVVEDLQRLKREAGDLCLGEELRDYLSGVLSAPRSAALSTAPSTATSTIAQTSAETDR